MKIVRARTHLAGGGEELTFADAIPFGRPNIGIRGESEQLVNNDS